jgi:squalene cyclase
MAPLTRTAGAEQSRQQGLGWLLRRQNSDGGWGAFDQNNFGSRLMKRFARNLTDAVELFDGSTADNTGHVLAGLGSFGFTEQRSRSVSRAFRYLRRTQNSVTGLWKGRWGINTLYGTTQAGTGLLRAGESRQAPYLIKAARTLISFQNSDGGFGESTLSYLQDEQRGRGISTPTQSAWVVEFLCEMGLQNTSPVRKAVNYLVESWNGPESWQDGSVVGTGHPGILYVEYPAYPKVFPLMALATYLNLP